MQKCSQTTAISASVLVVALGMTCVSPKAYADYETEDGKSKGWFLIWVIPVLNEVFKDQLKDTTAGLFKQWACKLWPAGNNCSSIGRPGQQPYGNMTFNSQPVMSPMQNISADDARKLAIAPAFLMAFDRLSDDSPNGAVTGTEQLDSTPSGYRQLTVHTGESFAFRFGATVPGRVRLINTDATGKVEQIGYYEIRAGVERRVPTEGKGGLKMTPPEGQEFLDIEYEACISPQMQSYPDVAKFQNDLPPCNNSQPATKSWASGKNYVPAPGTKGMFNAEAANTTQLDVAIAPPDFNAKSTGNMLRWRIVFNHQPADGSMTTPFVPAAPTPDTSVVPANQNLL